MLCSLYDLKIYRQRLILHLSGILPKGVFPEFGSYTDVKIFIKLLIVYCAQNWREMKIKEESLWVGYI